MNKRWFGVAVLTAVALGGAMAAENLPPKLTPDVTSSPPGATVSPAAATARKLPPYRDPMGIPTVTPVRQRVAGAGMGWSVSDETNAVRLAAAPLPDDIPAVLALHEQIRETLLLMVRRQVDMQVNASDQMTNVRDYRTKLRTEDPELLKLQQRLEALNSEREALIRQIDERFNQDNQYKKLTQQRVADLGKLRDVGAMNDALREKMVRLEQRQAELERQASLAATNQTRNAAPAVTIKQ